ATRRRLPKSTDSSGGRWPKRARSHRRTGEGMECRAAVLRRPFTFLEERLFALPRAWRTRCGQRAVRKAYQGASALTRCCAKPVDMNAMGTMGARSKAFLILEFVRSPFICQTLSRTEQTHATILRLVVRCLRYPRSANSSSTVFFSRCPRFSLVTR